MAGWISRFFVVRRGPRARSQFVGPRGLPPSRQAAKTQAQLRSALHGPRCHHRMARPADQKCPAAEGFPGRRESKGTLTVGGPETPLCAQTSFSSAMTADRRGPGNPDLAPSTSRPGEWGFKAPSVVNATFRQHQFPSSPPTSNGPRHVPRSRTRRKREDRRSTSSTYFPRPARPVLRRRPFRAAPRSPTPLATLLGRQLPVRCGEGPHPQADDSTAPSKKCTKSPARSRERCSTFHRPERRQTGHHEWPVRRWAFGLGRCGLTQVEAVDVDRFRWAGTPYGHNRSLRHRASPENLKLNQAVLDGAPGSKVLMANGSPTRIPTKVGHRDGSIPRTPKNQRGAHH